MEQDRTTGVAEVDSSAEVTYTRDIAGIVWQHCCPCHRPGQSAPFSLLTYHDVRARGSQIVDVIASGYMPPWLPEPVDVRYDGERRLQTADINAIRTWVATGVPRGDVVDLRSPPEFPSGWQLGEPDLIVEMPESYTLSAGGPDVYRNFVFPAPVRTTQYVRAVEIQPGNPQVVHHGVLLIDGSRSSRWLAADDVELGFDGMESGEAHSPNGYFPSWTPGKLPRLLPPGMAWRLDSGDDLVLQLHLLPSGKPEAIQAKIGLFIADQPPTRFPETLRLGSMTLDIRAGDSAYEVQDTYVLPVDVDVMSIYPHAHYLGKHIHLLAVLPTGEHRTLLRIDDWDFNWQDQYALADPIPLPRGTELIARFQFDNSAANPRRPQETPGRVVWGPQSSDEMGDIWVQLLPGSERDRLLLKSDFMNKELAAKVECYEQMVKHNPDDIQSHDSLAIALARVGQLGRAQTHFERSLSIDPKNVRSHFHLGLLWARKGQPDRAVKQFQQTLRLDPECREAHTSLATAYFKQQNLDAAEKHLRQAIRIHPDDARAYRILGTIAKARQDFSAAIEYLHKSLRLKPGDPDAHYELGVALQVQGEIGKAIVHYRRTLADMPHHPQANFNLGAALESQGEYENAARHYRQAIQVDDAYAAPHINLAWLLATHPDPNVRDAKEALDLAQRAQGLDQKTRPEWLDVLAAALAAAGRFDEAVEVARQAVEAAGDARSPDVAQAIRARLELYKEHKPYRLPTSDAKESSP